ncbi:MAG TPA: T9SS type A sorting domain-containing protein [Flavobacteriales bacterium]|nr:T9SS type A sorting domain-containing protein [Flavobacteriales bacterium]
MQWDGSEWSPLAGGTDGPVKSVKVINDELIVAGWFTYADTVLANGLARWDGERWHRVVDVPPFYNGDGPNQIWDVEKYQGQWYIGGSLPVVDDLARWNGSSWEQVGGFLGGISAITRLRVYDERLFVAGSFSQCPPNGVASNPGSGIVAWNGSTFDDLGGGTCGSTVSEVIGMAWWNDELYVAGRFNMIGGVPGDKLAKWDGEEWCTLTPPGYFGNGTPGALAIYHDSLYIGGAFVEVGGYDVSCFGKWIGGDETYACGALTGMTEDPSSPGFSVFPNPTTDQLIFQGLPSSTTTLRIRDVLGREVLRTSALSSTLYVGHLPPGTYSLSAFDRSGQVVATARFVRQ